PCCSTPPSIHSFPLTSSRMTSSPRSSASSTSAPPTSSWGSRSCDERCYPRCGRTSPWPPATARCPRRFPACPSRPSTGSTIPTSPARTRWPGASTRGPCSGCTCGKARTSSSWTTKPSSSTSSAVSSSRRPGGDDDDQSHHTARREDREKRKRSPRDGGGRGAQARHPHVRADEAGAPRPRAERGRAPFSVDGGGSLRRAREDRQPAERRQGALRRDLRLGGRRTGGPAPRRAQG